MQTALCRAHCAFLEAIPGPLGFQRNLQGSLQRAAWEPGPALPPVRSEGGWMARAQPEAQAALTGPGRRRERNKVPTAPRPAPICSPRRPPSTFLRRTWPAPEKPESYRPWLPPLRSAWCPVTAAGRPPLKLHSDRPQVRFDANPQHDAK